LALVMESEYEELTPLELISVAMAASPMGVAKILEDGLEELVDDFALL
jgi:hypothetical protein